jgi:carbohydrate kinase (thermoresistant glucokinase family)
MTCVVVMGVSGCGKSTVGRSLANALKCCFIEGDEFHPPENVRRMAAGIALTDADRQGWLESLVNQMRLEDAKSLPVVLACSALKKSYRDLLRTAAADVRFVHLQGSFDLLTRRMKQRSGHYMPASLLESQFASLQPPGSDEEALTYQVDGLVQDITSDIVRNWFQPRE